jgi:hypothetical protein
MLQLYALVMGHPSNLSVLELEKLTWEQLVRERIKLEEKGWWQIDVMEQQDYDMLDRSE